jgi:hypothetical protein
MWPRGWEVVEVEGDISNAAPPGSYEIQESRLRMYQIPATPSVKAVICAKVRPVARIL